MLNYSLDNISKRYDFTLTPLRAEVMDIFIKKGSSLKANEVINYVNTKRSNTKPIVIYRVLNFLVEKKVLHKIQSQNIFILCTDNLCSQNNGNKIFLSCKNCKQIKEIGDKVFLEKIKNLCSSNNFTLKDSTIELNGYCNNCMNLKN
jgi:Fur family transcriptional regulator, zinc uptake regulator